MALLNNEFDATEVEPAQPFEVVPPGWYVGQITQSEMKPTNAGTGHYLQLAFTILEGEHVRRVIFDRLNLDNPNQETVKWARADLSAICRAVGVSKLRDSEQLHNTPIEFKIAIRPADGEYSASNDVKGYRAHAASQSARAAQPWNNQAATQQQPASTQQQPAATQQQAAPATPQQQPTAPQQQPAAPAPSNAAPWE